MDLVWRKQLYGPRVLVIVGPISAFTRTSSYCTNSCTKTKVRVKNCVPIGKVHFKLIIQINIV